MIDIKNLCKSFGKKEVLKGLSLNIKDNSIFGLVGINGAGKSTLLRILSGVYRQDSGEVLYDGLAANDLLVKGDIFYLPDEPYYPANATVETLVDFYNVFYTLNKENFDKYFKLFGLDKALKEVKAKKNYTINNFSKGMKRQLFICIALAIAPKYLFLDESFDGLDPLARLQFKRLLIEISSEKNMTVIISSHSLRELEDICESYGLLDDGEIVSSGGIDETKSLYHKYQLAFEREIFIEDFKDLEIVSFNKIGRVYKIVCKGEEEYCYNAIMKMNPLLIDRINIDFEELFIIEVESKGYIYEK